MTVNTFEHKAKDQDIRMTVNGDRNPPAKIGSVDSILVYFSRCGVGDVDCTD